LSKFKKAQDLSVPLSVPEDDNGASWSGKAVASSLMWIPKELVGNSAMFIRSATIRSVNERTGQVSSIPLAQEFGSHIAVAKHFFSNAEWAEKVTTNIITPGIEKTWEKFDFGDKITPRKGDQEKAWEIFKKQPHGVLNLACGKGKTVMALKQIAYRGYPAVVIVNNSGLMDQWKERALEFLDISPDDIGIVQGPREEWDKPLVIAMIHTLSNRAPDLSMEIRQRFGTIVFDEVHHLSASKFVLTAPLFFGARFGLTATPNREDGLEEIYYAHVGRVFYSDLEGELDANVYFHEVETKPPRDESVIQDVTGEFSAGKMYQYMAQDFKRNKDILTLVANAVKKGRKILVLTHSKDHPEILMANFLDRHSAGEYTVGAVTGATPGDERIKIIKDSDVTFATFQIAREGLDVAALDTLIFATPFKSWGAFQQGKGRVERRYSGKKDPIVVVIDDHLFGPAGAMCRNLRRNVATRGIKYSVIRGKSE
jgi:superfamily II DNA or RNA helicase